MTPATMTPELRLGRWQAALKDVGEVDALIVDAPYSDRTHAGHFSGCSDDSTDPAWLARRGYDDKRSLRRAISYSSWTDGDVKEFVASWAPRTRGWFVTITSHDLAPVYASALELAGRYVFAPLPFVEPGKCPRLTGDGPASWSCWIVVARPKSVDAKSWGSLPGCYVFPKGTVEQTRTVVGGKPLALMRALIRDYTRPGDLVCDPCAGGATTLLAAAMEGRRSIGSEMDPETYAKAKRRLAAGYTPDLFNHATPGAP